MTVYKTTYRFIKVPFQFESNRRWAEREANRSKLAQSATERRDECRDELA